MSNTKSKIPSFFNKNNYIFLFSMDEPGIKDLTKDILLFSSNNKLYLLKGKKTQLTYNIKSESVRKRISLCSGNVLSVGTNDLHSAIFFYSKFINKAEGSNLLCCLAFKYSVRLQIYQMLYQARNLMSKVSIFNLIFFFSRAFRMQLIIILRLLAYKKNNELLIKLFLD